MIYKMKMYFVIPVFLVILFCSDCHACFQTNSENERSISTGSPFYEECCCTDETYTAKDLTWLDPSNNVIGPGTDSNVYIEDQGGDCVSLHISNAIAAVSGPYRCVTTYNGATYTDTHNVYVYDPLYFYNNTSPQQYLVYGKDSMIRCEAKGASKPLFKWTRGENGVDEIFNSTKYAVAPGGLIVRNVTDEDSGIYKCTASVMSTGEENEINIEVKILTLPTITYLRASPEAVVIENESLMIECQAEGYPYPEIQFRKISDTPSNGTRYTRWRQDGRTIIFDSVVAEDAGKYECFAKNYVGNISQTIEIEVYVAPKIIGFSDRAALEGTEIPIHCNATGNPPPKITITFEGKNLSTEQNTEYAHVIENYSILKVNRSKEGIYICNATNDVNFETQIMYLTVHHPPHFEIDRETVWGWNGEYVNVNCQPEANPPANISWSYSIEEPGDLNVTEINENLTNFVGDVGNYTFHMTDEYAPYGSYICKAINNLGTAFKVFDVKQGYKPSNVPNVSVEDVSPSSATFIIEPTIELVGPELLGFTAEYDTNENYNITDIHPNRTWAMGTIYKLEGLKANSSYLIKFAAVNKVGTGPWGEMIHFETEEKSAPESPIWLSDSLQPPNNVLKWKASADNGEPIDFYKLKYCQVTEDWNKVHCETKRVVGAIELELNHLEQNATYYFEITAHNSEGYSEPANITLFVPAYVESLESVSILSGGAIIGISVVVVLVCLVLLDLLLLFWRQQGIIASCCYKKSKKKPNPLHSRDKKGLLKDNAESTDDTLRRPNNGHREYEYNKTTGIITGKHSSV